MPRTNHTDAPEGEVWILIPEQANLSTAPSRPDRRMDIDPEQANHTERMLPTEGDFFCPEPDVTLAIQLSQGLLAGMKGWLRLVVSCLGLTAMGVSARRQERTIHQSHGERYASKPEVAREGRLMKLPGAAIYWRDNWYTYYLVFYPPGIIRSWMSTSINIGK